MTREERNLLISAIDGSLPADAEPRLRELLKRDPGMLEMFAGEALLHAELEWHHDIRRQSIDSFTRRAEVVREYRLRQSRRLALASMGIAAVVLLMLGIGALLRQVPPPTVGLRFNEEALSRLVSASQDHASPAPGDRLILERGAVEITLPQGVMAVVEAPAELEFAEGNTLVMDHGTGYFRIGRRQAHGFTLVLPDSEVVDLGTSFGVIAPAGGPTEIHVIDGSVRTQRRSGAFESPEDMKPGEAYREDDGSETGYVPTIYRSDRFPRQLPDRYQHVRIDFDRRDGEGNFLSRGEPAATIRVVDTGRGGVRNVEGRLGNAVAFGSGGSHIEVRGWSEYHHRPSGTLSFWMRLPERASRWRSCPVSWGSDARADIGRWSVAIETDGGDPRLSIRGGMDRSYHLTAEAALKPGLWHHVAFAFDPESEDTTRVRVFIDGVEQPESMTVPVIPGPAPDDAFIIGTHHDRRLWSSHAFTGAIDDLRIYRAVLDEDDIAVLARGGEPSKAK